MSVQLNCLQNASFSTSGIPYGFHNIDKIPGPKEEKEVKRFFRRINIFNALSYIPLVNVISAIVAMALIGRDASAFKKATGGKLPADLKKILDSAIGSEILRMFFSTLMIVPDAIFGFARLSVYSNPKLKRELQP